MNNNKLMADACLGDFLKHEMLQNINDVDVFCQQGSRSLKLSRPVALIKILKPCADGPTFVKVN